MNLLELRNEARIRLDDLGGTGVLWTDEDLTRYANNGEREICRRALSIKDTSTTAATFTTVAGTNLYALDSSVLFVERAAVDPGDRLKRISMDVLDTVLNWGSQAGVPKYFSTDYQDNKILLVPKPNAALDVVMTVYRLPAALMAADTDEPEIPEELHRYIIDWMCFEAYSKNDADATSVEKAEYYFNKFAASIGEPRRADIFAVSRRLYPKSLPKAVLDGNTADKAGATK